MAVGRMALLDVAHLAIRTVFIARTLRLATVASDEPKAEGRSEYRKRESSRKGHEGSSRLVDAETLPELLQSVIKCSSTATGPALTKARQALADERTAIALPDRALETH